MIKRLEIPVIGVLCLLTAQCIAATVHGPVSTRSTLRDAIASAKPGDVVLMANGVWTDIFIDFAATGAPGKPITLRAEVDGQVRLQGRSWLRFAGDHLVVRGLHFTKGTIPADGHVIAFRRSSSELANHCRLTQCAITDFNPEDPSVNYKWVSVYGRHNRVDHCAFTGMNHEGVTLTVWLRDSAPANHTRIDNNLFANRSEGSGNGYETIRIGTSSRSLQDSKTIVENNYFYRCDGEIEIISNKSGANVFRHNTFESCSGQLTLRHGNGCRVEGNYFLGNGVPGSSGVRVIGEDHVVVNNYFDNLRGTGFRAALGIMSGVPDSPLNRYFQVQRALIAFNTFTGCTENFVIGLNSSDTSLPPTDCVIANNIVTGSESPLIEYDRAPLNMHYEGNIFHGASLGTAQSSGIEIVDPLLSPATDGLSRPASNSPAVDAAVGTYPDITVDIDGHARVTGSKDIGADELDLTASIHRPLTEERVGPNWMRPSTLVMKGATLTSTHAEIVFEDQTGLAPSYHLQRSEDLGSNSWIPVTSFAPVAHSSTVFTVIDPTPPVDNTVFWRVVRD